MVTNIPHPASISSWESLITEYAIFICSSNFWALLPHNMGTAASGSQSIFAFRKSNGRVRCLASKYEFEPVGNSYVPYSSLWGKLIALTRWRATSMLCTLFVGSCGCRTYCWSDVERSMSTGSWTDYIPVVGWRASVVWEETAYANHKAVVGSGCLVTRCQAMTGWTWWTPSGDMPSAVPPTMSRTVIK